MVIVEAHNYFIFEKIPIIYRSPATTLDVQGAGESPATL